MVIRIPQQRYPLQFSLNITRVIRCKTIRSDVRKMVKTPYVPQNNIKMDTKILCCKNISRIHQLSDAVLKDFCKCGNELSDFTECMG